MKKILKTFLIIACLLSVYYIAAEAIYGSDENGVLQIPSWFGFVGFTWVSAGTWLIMRHQKHGPKADSTAEETGNLVEEANKTLRDNKRLSPEEIDALYSAAKQAALTYGSPSEIYLQHKLNIGFSDAQILTSRMKAEGLFSPEAVIEPTLPSHSPQSVAKPVIPQEHLDTDSIIDEEEAWHRKQRHLSPLENELYNIDHMESEDFEVWCAELLKKSGFEDVRRIGKSGDQSVDVLAEKDGITYAIQCKCYSRDLGNEPVQKVSTGKQIYHCHVGAVMTNCYFTKDAVDAATATGTKLWDRSWLIEKIGASSPKMPKTSILAVPTSIEPPAIVHTAPAKSVTLAKESSRSGPRAKPKPSVPSSPTDDYMMQILMDEHKWRKKQRQENAESQNK